MPLNIFDQDFPKSQLYDHIAKYYNPTTFIALQNIISTLFFYYLTFIFENINPLVSIICVIIRTGLYVRIFLIMHDNGHESLFKSKLANDVCGNFMAGITGAGFYNWKEKHNYHHKITNDLRYFQQGQSAPYSVSEFLKIEPKNQRIYLFFMSRFSMVFILPSLYRVFNFYIMIKRDHICLILFGLFNYFKFQYFSFIYDQIALQNAALIGLFFFHIQHTFKNVKRKANISHIEQGLLGASFLQVHYLIKYFTLGIEYHHIHHLNAKVPGYLLRACHEDAEKEGNGYYWEMVNRVGWKELIDIKYVLYDEKKDRMITLEELRNFYDYKKN